MCVCAPHLLWPLPSAGSVGSRCLERSQSVSLCFKYPDFKTFPLRTQSVGRDFKSSHRSGGSSRARHVCIYHEAVCLLNGESDWLSYCKYMCFCVCVVLLMVWAPMWVSRVTQSNKEFFVSTCRRCSSCQTHPTELHILYFTSLPLAYTPPLPLFANDKLHVLPFISNRYEIVGVWSKHKPRSMIRKIWVSLFGMWQLN